MLRCLLHGRNRALLGRGPSAAPPPAPPDAASYFGARLLYWNDPTDHAITHQDSARTTGWALDNPVGSRLNKGTLGGYATQAVSGKRPIARQDANGFDYDGGDNLDDFLSIALDLSTQTAITLVMGLRETASTTTAVAMEFSANASSNNGAFYVATPNAANTIGVNLRGTTAARYDSTGYAAPQNRLLVASLDIAGTGIANEIFPYIDGVLSQVGPTGTDCGTGSFGSHVLYELMRAGTSFPLAGGLYQRMIISGVLDATDRAWITTYAGAKQGKTL